MKKIKLSIVILNHNTKKLLKNCLNSIYKSNPKLSLEIIVSDNASTDGSVKMIKKHFHKAILLQGPNISFSSGNNRARKIVNGEYVLFLNSDTEVEDDTLDESIKYLDTNKQAGALTCKLVLRNGKLDPDTRRRFSTPWISFNRLFLGNGKKYWYKDVDENTTHEVDSIQGAFFLTTKEILDKVGWFDENYYFDGEDLDLCFQIKKLGYKIIYYPKVKALHLKKATRNKIGKDEKIKRKLEGVNSMEYFYRKNLSKNYPWALNQFVYLGIRLLRVSRYLNTKIL